MSFRPQIFLKSGNAATRIQTIKDSSLDRSGGGYSSVYDPFGYLDAQFGGGATLEGAYCVGAYLSLSVGQAIPDVVNSKVVADGALTDVRFDRVSTYIYYPFMRSLFVSMAILILSNIHTIEH